MADVMTEEEAPNTTFLKTVVIILGFLIIGVATLIIFTIYKRAMTPSPDTAVTEIPVPDNAKIPSLTTTFGDVVLNAPEGLMPINVASSDGRLIVTYGLDTSHPQIVVIVNQTNGEVLGRIILKK